MSLQFIIGRAGSGKSTLLYKNLDVQKRQITTGEITDLGKLYQSLGMPEGYENSSKVKKEKNTQKDIVK